MCFSVKAFKSFAPLRAFQWAIPILIDKIKGINCTKNAPPLRSGHSPRSVLICFRKDCIPPLTTYMPQLLRVHGLEKLQHSTPGNGSTTSLCTEGLTHNMDSSHKICQVWNHVVQWQGIIESRIVAPPLSPLPGGRVPFNCLYLSLSLTQNKWLKCVRRITVKYCKLAGYNTLPSIPTRALLAWWWETSIETSKDHTHQADGHREKESFFKRMRWSNMQKRIHQSYGILSFISNLVFYFIAGFLYTLHNPLLPLPTCPIYSSMCCWLVNAPGEINFASCGGFKPSAFRWRSKHLGCHSPPWWGNFQAQTVQWWPRKRPT